MDKKLLLGCSAFVALVVIGIGAFVMLRSSGPMGAGVGGDRDALARRLEQELGAAPQVEFLCRLPVVGEAPCVMEGEMGTREVQLRFENYALPEGVPPEAHARAVALLSFRSSEFVRGADRTDVIFETVTGAESARIAQTATYSFTPHDLATDSTPGANPQPPQ